jgi:feruloyl esterase
MVSVGSVLGIGSRLRLNLYLIEMLAVGLVVGAQPALSATCESLLSLKLPDTTITAVQSVAAGEFAPAPVPPGPPGARGAGAGAGGAATYSGLPAFCRVVARLTPSSDSDIKMEVWMPLSGWNGDFQAAANNAGANAALQGVINTQGLATALRAGYATASTDLGHDGATASYAIDHPEKLIDFGYRAFHEMTVKAKAIVRAYYGSAPKFSYLDTCAAGGRQALREAQSYPADFDGIAVGAPGNNWTHIQVWSLRDFLATHKDAASLIPQSKFALIHQAAIDLCDTLDGVKDGLIENPMPCKFDPGVLECKGEDEPSCLTAAQVASARTIYSSAINPRTKEEIFPGLEPGSELSWAAHTGGTQPTLYVQETFKYMVFKDPNWDYKTRPFDFDRDTMLADKLDHETVNADGAILKAYFARGGKLLQYHGWSDANIAPRSSINYYLAVAKTTGGVSKIQNSYRLFMEPGVGHCRGGEGPDSFDTLGTVVQWVEQKKAPDQIVASRIVNGKVVRTRPLCPYPQVATYSGTGSTDDAANFVCKAP